MTGASPARNTYAERKENQPTNVTYYGKSAPIIDRGAVKQLG